MDKINKKNICFFIGSLGGGGAERITLNLINNLNPDKYLVSLIVLNNNGEYSKFINHNIKLHSLDVSEVELNLISNLKKISKLRKLIKNINPQTIFSNGYYCNLLVILARFFISSKIKLIIRETNILLARKKYKSHGWIKLTAFFILYRFADILIAPCDAIINDFKKLIRSNNLNYVVISNFVDTSLIDSCVNHPAKEDATNVPKTNLPIIISIGRLIPQKGYEVALQAFREVLNQSLCEYWILGQGPLEKTLKQKAKDLHISEHVKFLGFQRNPYIFLKNADILFLPSEFEGFPNVLLESMHLGLPCVMTPFNESASHIIKSGKNGLITKHLNNPNEMAILLIKLLNNKQLYESIKEQTQFNSTEYNRGNALPIFETIL